MFKYHYEILYFVPKDYQTYQLHFQDMAKKGKVVDYIGARTVRYRKEEPQDIYYCFDVVEDVSPYAGIKSEQFKDYQEFIEDSDWKLVCRINKYQLFASKNKDAKPLHSDENLFYSMMQREKKRSYLSLLAMEILLALLIYSLISIKSYTILFSNFDLAYIVYLISLTGLGLYVYAKNYIHLKQNDKLLATNQLPKSRNYLDIKIESILSLILVFNFIFILKDTLSALEILYFGVIIYSFWIVCDWLLQTKNSENKNKFYIFLLYCVYFFSLTPLFFSIEEPSYIYPKDFLVNHLVDIVGYDHESSIFVKRYDHLWQYYSENEDIRVTYLDSRFEILTDYVFNQRMKSYKLNNSHLVLNSLYENYYHDEDTKIVLIKDKNKLINIIYDNKELFDLDGIIKDCIEME